MTIRLLSIISCCLTAFAVSAANDDVRNATFSHPVVPGAHGANGPYGGPVKVSHLEVAYAAKKLSDDTGGPIRIIVSRQTGYAARALDLGALEFPPRVKPLKNIGIDILELDHGEPVANVVKTTEFISTISGFAYQEADSLRQLPDDKPSAADSPPVHLRRRLEDKCVTANGVSPNDPKWSDMWGMKDIDAPMAWTMTTGENSAIRPRVVVIDTGVDYTHPDLVNSIWTNEAEANGLPGVDDDGNGYIDDIHGWNAITGLGDPKDDHGHGTHCSGTIGATGNNLLGVPGVNWLPEIVGCKFLSASGGGYTSDAMGCIDYSLAVKATISSNSWGGGAPSNLLQAAIERARDAGQLFVVAAGNAGNDNDQFPSYPSSYQVENIVSVAALASDNDLPYWSNYGKKSVHIAAPGAGITSTDLYGGYATWSGTSMAAPHVSGVAALMKSLDPTIDIPTIKQHLKAGVQPFKNAADKTIWAGKLNAYQSLLLMEPSTTTPSPTTSVSPTTLVSPSARIILGASALTCEEHCAQSGLVCDEDETTNMNKNVDYCHTILNERANIRLPFINSHEQEPLPDTSSASGCYVRQFSSFGLVAVNTNNRGSLEFGCKINAAPLSNSARPCFCNHEV